MHKSSSRSSSTSNMCNKRLSSSKRKCKDKPKNSNKDKLKNSSKDKPKNSSKDTRRDAAHCRQRQRPAALAASAGGSAGSKQLRAGQI